MNLEQRQENKVIIYQFCYINGRLYKDNRYDETLEKIEHYQLVFDKRYQKKFKNILKQLNNKLKYHYNNKRVKKDTDYEITIQLIEEINNLLYGE